VATTGFKAPQALLLESNEIDSLLLQRVFREVAGHWHIAWEKDGAAAVRRIVNQGYPDLLVTRLDLPTRSGNDVIEWVRSLLSPKPVTILVYDGVVTSQQRQSLEPWGIKEYLDKHSSPEKLKIAIRRITTSIEKSMVSTEML
jgi:CheY-like chemotaxis protein